MTEQSAGTPDTGTAGPADEHQGTPDTGTPGPDTTDWQAEAAKFRDLARKHEQQAKENVAAAKELGRVRREAMSEQERAVSEAVERARAETAAEVTIRLGGRLVDAAIRLAVGDRLGADQVTALLERVDLSSFLTETGDVDTGSVTRWAESIAPESKPSTAFPDLGQGVRVPVVNGAPDPLLGSLKGKLGIS
jgi:hypothetical protein